MKCPMKSIYNEHLVPIAASEFQPLEEKFRAQVRELFEQAQATGLNLREVSHEFILTMTNIESEFVLTAAMERHDEETHG